jgi:hypothetical protein
MKSIFIFLVAVVLVSACGLIGNKSDVASGGNSGVGSSPKFQTGSDVLYMFDEYHFYEAKVVGVDSDKVKLSRNDTTLERKTSDVYEIPKDKNKITVAAGDFVAARYGTLPTWPTAKVLKVGDGKVTVKRIISGSTEDLSPENVLPVSKEAAAKIEQAAAKKGI